MRVLDLHDVARLRRDVRFAVAIPRLADARGDDARGLGDADRPRPRRGGHVAREGLVVEGGGH